MTISEQLRRFIVDNYLFGQDEDLNEETSFLESGILDSTGVLELVNFLDERFGIRLDDAEIIPENLDSISRLTQFLTRKLVNPEPQAAELCL